MSDFKEWLVANYWRPGNAGKRLAEAAWDHQQQQIDAISDDLNRIMCERYELQQQIEQQRAELERLKWREVPERYTSENYDQFPPIDTPVLATGLASGRKYLTAAMLVDTGEGWIWAQLCSTYDPDLWDASEYAYDEDYVYTHWMPLPPPEEQQEKPDE